MSLFFDGYIEQLYSCTLVLSLKINAMESCYLEPPGDHWEKVPDNRGSICITKLMSNFIVFQSLLIYTVSKIKIN